MGLNSFNFFYMFKFFLHCLFIIQRILFSFWNSSYRFSSLRFPNSYIHIITTTQNILIIHSPFYSVYNLHSFTMINFSTSSLLVIKYSNGFIVWTCNKFFTSGRIIKIHNCTDMIFMNKFSFFHISHIERISICVIRTNGEVYGFSWIPTNSMRFIR